MPLLEGIKRSINTKKKQMHEDREFKQKVAYETKEAERQAYREAYRKAALKRARAKGSAKATGKGFGLNFGSVAKAGKQFAVNMQSTFGDDLGQRKGGKRQKPWWED